MIGADRAPVRVLPCGADSLLVEVADLQAAMDLAAALRPLTDDGPLCEVVTGARTVLVRAAPGVGPTELGSLVRAARPSERASGQQERVEVPVRYDGEDLAEVSRLTGLSEAEVVAAHTGSPWRVAFCGFAPGFAYLTGGDKRLRVPRRDTSRTRVPAGAVGLAGEFSGVYPRESPGGWQLIGRTDLVVWDTAADPPALLRPGMQVHFTERTGEPSQPSDPASQPRGRAAEASGRADLLVEATGRADLVVEATGPLSTVQDLGRPGYADLGVGRSGAADPAALRHANRLVGNSEHAAAIEVTAGGLRLRAGRAVLVAAAGAPSSLTVEGHQYWTGEAVRVAAGHLLVLGVPTSGLRTYLAIRGGFEVEAVLGSRSTDLLSGLGPPRLEQGARLAVGPEPASAVPPSDGLPGREEPQGAARGRRPLRIRLGPRADWFTSQAHAALGATTWGVTPRSDRVGLRLQGADLPRTERARDLELPSEGMVEGAVQVPPSSEPVLFLADHPVTGGYPVIGVVEPADLGRAAQLRPGDTVRFTTYH